MITFRVVTQSCVTFENTPSPQKKPLPISSQAPFSPYPAQPLTTTDVLFGPMICLFWTFHINGIIEYDAHCHRLTSSFDFTYVGRPTS